MKRTRIKKGGEKVKCREISGSCKDYVVSNLRSQLTTLRSIIETVENTEIIDEEYVDEFLKRIESNLCALRTRIDSF